MRIRFIVLASALLFALGACAGSMGPDQSMRSTSQHQSGSTGGMGGGGGY